MSNTVSETTLINVNIFSTLNSLPGDRRRPSPDFLKRSPDKNQRLVLLNDKGIYHVKYSVRNSLDKRKKIQSYKRLQQDKPF